MESRGAHSSSALFIYDDKKDPSAFGRCAPVQGCVDDRMGGFRDELLVLFYLGLAPMYTIRECHESFSLCFFSASLLL